MPDRMEGMLSFADDGVRLTRSLGGPPLRVPVAAVGSLFVTSEQVAKSKVGPVLAFGVLGLAAKGSRTQATLVIRSKGDEEEAGYFTVQDASAAEVKAKLEGWLRSQGIPWYEDLEHVRSAEASSATATPPLSIADELQKLATLRLSGVLSDEEFATLKARLING
jgi:hypothetical protein